MGRDSGNLPLIEAPQHTRPAPAGRALGTRCEPESLPSHPVAAIAVIESAALQRERQELSMVRYLIRNMATGNVLRSARYRSRAKAQTRCDGLNQQAQETGKGRPYDVVEYHERTEPAQ